jgi:acetyl esterase/lipase
MGPPACPRWLSPSNVDVPTRARNNPNPPRLWVSWMRAGLGQRSIKIRNSRQAGEAGSGPEPLAVVSYMHGGGWDLESTRSGDRLVRKPTVEGDAAVAFVEYALAPNS